MYTYVYTDKIALKEDLEIHTYNNIHFMKYCMCY